MDPLNWVAEVSVWVGSNPRPQYRSYGPAQIPETLPAIPEGALLLLSEADKSDPLNQLFVAALRLKGLMARVTFAETGKTGSELRGRYEAFAISCLQQVMNDYRQHIE